AGLSRVQRPASDQPRHLCHGSSSAAGRVSPSGKLSMMEKRRRRMPRPSVPLMTILGLLLLTSSSASPWGAIGHRIVGRIAEQHLSAEARQQLQALLGPESLAQVSTWPDEIRADPAWNHAAPWHYVNIADNETYETAPKNPGGDVVAALQRFTTVLRD